MNRAEDIQFQIENNHTAKYNLIVDKISKITIHYDRFNPTRAGSYIEAPEWIKNKKACINIKNEDNKCFKYAVQCGVFERYKKDHPERVSHYIKLKDNILNWEQMKYPAGNADILRFEELNSGLISVNVFEVFQEHSIINLRRTKVRNAKHHVDLMKIESEGKSHYMFIKDLSRLCTKAIRTQSVSEDNALLNNKRNS